MNVSEDTEDAKLYHVGGARDMERETRVELATSAWEAPGASPDRASGVKQDVNLIEEVKISFEFVAASRKPL